MLLAFDMYNSLWKHGVYDGGKYADVILCGGGGFPKKKVKFATCLHIKIIIVLELCWKQKHIG